MRKVKVAAASLCLLSYGMLHGGIINTEVSVAKTDMDDMIEMTAESVTTPSSIETTSIVTTVTTATTAVPAGTTASRTTAYTARSSAPATTTAVSTTAPVTEAAAETVPASTVQSEPAQSLSDSDVPEATTMPDAADAAPSTQAETDASAETEAEVTAEESGAITVTDREYIMLCNVVGHEYGSDWVPEAEKALVAEVIMNRVNSPAFPNTIYDVLMQRNQFSGLEYLVRMDKMSGYVTDSVKAAVDMYLADPSQFDHGYLYFNGDGYRNYFRTAY